MIKAAGKYIVPFLLIVLTGHFFATASTHENIVRYARQKVSQAGAILGYDLHRHTLIPGYGVTDRKLRDKIYVEEKEEENFSLPFGKTYSCDRSCFAPSYSGARDLFLASTGKQLPINAQRLSYPYRIYLLLKVFRI
ncbi:hypothetical protein [Dyadobacter aurulentus]|uniref:hypothetical protein n=1 Tax=Dyadobacter sp. UC 10 TaxID=2605428 RepID=UPI0011F16B98|nr:hypothetical protein [Dyadobacter sp. UC 10]KAA0992193.1 hypothetical protein FXO21_19425 [Dyadobacter sp. UC 10]